VAIDERAWWLLAALALDALAGDPEWLWRRIAHPVVLAGRVVSALDRRLNRDEDPPARRRRQGRLALALLLGLSLAAGGGLCFLARTLHGGALLEIAAVALLLAQRSLYEHVAAVGEALRADRLGAARRAVSRIVGREPGHLDAPAVGRAAIESLAENFSDAVVAPALWYLVAGLPGILAYKALNTADSMIGQRSARHLDFGRAAARADDLANLPASRLSALLLIGAAAVVDGRASGGRALGSVRRDAARHRSPNAGWPEAAMAGALDRALAGPRRYAEGDVDDAWMHPGGSRNADGADVGRALRLYVAACAGLAGVVALLALGLA